MADDTNTPEDAYFVPNPTPDGPDKESNEKRLQQMLSSYQKALEEEWETDEAYKEGELPPSQIRSKTKQLLTQAVPKSVGSMLYLAQHATNESVRFKASSYIIDKALGKESSGLVGDPLEVLLNDIEQSKGQAQ